MAKQWYEMTPEEIDEKVAEQATEDADEAELENIEKAIEIDQEIDAGTWHTDEEPDNN